MFVPFVGTPQSGLIAQSCSGRSRLTPRNAPLHPSFPILDAFRYAILTPSDRRITQL